MADGDGGGDGDGDGDGLPSKMDKSGLKPQGN